MRTRDLTKVRLNSPSLTGVLAKFCSHSERLKQIFKETKKCFNDINISGRFQGDQVISAELLKEEALAITSVIEYPPTFVIFGQSPYAKSRIVNELFDKDVFPSLEENSDVQLRMVRFCHGDKSTLSLALPDDYDLVDNLEGYKGPWVTIPLADLEIPPKGASDEASEVAVLEVTQNHPLLRYGVQVIVSASHSTGQFEDVVNKCIEYSTPVLIFGFTSDRLSEQDVMELHQLSQLTNMEPILFVQVPPPCWRTVDTDPPDGAPTDISPYVATPETGATGLRSNNSSTMLSATTSYFTGTATRAGKDLPTSDFSSRRDLRTVAATAGRSVPSAPRKCCRSSSCPDGFDISSSPQSLPTNSAYDSDNFSVKKKDARKNGRGVMSPVHSADENSTTNTYKIPYHYLACCIQEQLRRLGYIWAPEPNLPDDPAFTASSSPLPSSPLSSGHWQSVKREHLSTESQIVKRFMDFQGHLARFTRRNLQTYLVNAATVLNNCHTRCLNMFILSAFDMARDMLITPRRLEFAREKEGELYKSLLSISVSKMNEIKELITTAIEVIGSCIVAEAGEFEFIGIEMSSTDQVSSTREVQACTCQIREFVLNRLNHAVADKLMSSVDILRDSYTGTLTRTLESLETLDTESPEEAKATDALKEILNAAYTVEITVRSSSSFIKNLLEKMKQLVQSLPWKAPPVMCTSWKERVAQDMLSSLSEARLARSISSHIKDRLSKSHEQFCNALRQLEMRHTGRLDKIEAHRLKLRKVHAPRLAKMALESTSLRDVTLFGMPDMGREIGRGQYGVVYSCDSWGSHSPCAIKSVVPPDDKHWNDLALEFFFTKNIPEHPRIVMLRGSVIDYLYGGGTSPAVLLVMDRLQKDLYTAIKHGLDWLGRLQVAIDVVAGLRYLHSQGLVHRDVKLKNVLLDRENRAKITDLGFCKPEAMMSGSIVGTPIHMAPELFTGRYDNSVDVYAFGVLLWYVCAGHVRLPTVFQQCGGQEQLWQSVKKGLRPEKPSDCCEDCWNLMNNCWKGDPLSRPFFGDVEVSLNAIVDKYKKDARSKASGVERRRGSRIVSSKHRDSQIRGKRTSTFK